MARATSGATGPYCVVSSSLPSPGQMHWQGCDTRPCADGVGWTARSESSWLQRGYGRSTTLSLRWGVAPMLGQTRHVEFGGVTRLPTAWIGARAGSASQIKNLAAVVLQAR